MPSLNEVAAGEGLAEARILVVDDEPGMRHFLTKTLRPLCAAVDEAEDVVTATERLGARHYDVMILDNMMPGQKGIDWLVNQQREGGTTDTILITAYADLQTAIDALRAGATDFVLKPFRSNQIINALRRCIEMARLRRENWLLRRELENALPGRRRRRELVGNSPAIETVKALLDRVAQVSTPVLITGQSGSGKEVAARHLHARSARAGGPFVPIQCGTIPNDMIELELFGHAAGVVPGAVGSREGLLASAGGGTVFLDEVSELGPGAQRALLRVLEDGVIRPVGTERAVQLDVRFVMSTTRPLRAAVEAGRFREDLLFRINVIEVEMARLSDRGNDVCDLAELFLQEIAETMQISPPELTAPVRAALLRHDWPGNIRELRNFIERSLIFGRFQLETLDADEETRPITSLENLERREILRALDLLGGNRSEAARQLGISRKTIDRKCAAWGL
ncbi:sigma-54-dependent transcriptional regulator [Ponticoccus sp. (in: a-proteobacteria)]|uniref:sigma-54-dependent transcriptional regulator n=1 Tax=Ponticoccus sp. (in: a-proteobacteria) TaxID=1925025 RepID=UPI003AB8DAEB